MSPIAPRRADTPWVTSIRTRLPADVLERLRSQYLVTSPPVVVIEGGTEVEPEVADKTTGAMVAFMLPQDIADVLAVSGGERPEDLHLTLAYLPVAPEGDELERLKALVAGFAATEYQLEGTIAGIGLFTAGPKPVTVALPDFPGLPKFRTDLVRLIEDAGFDVSAAHGYTPHITLAYENLLDGLQEPNIDFVLGHVSVCVGEDRTAYPLTSPEQEELEAAAKQPKETPKYAVETEMIKQNKTLAISQSPHRSAPATQPNNDGSRRCLLCGDTVPPNNLCGDPNQPPAAPTAPFGQLNVPIAAQLGNTTYFWPTVGQNPFDITTATATATATGGYTAPATTSLREVPELSKPEWTPTTKAFVTELNGKTLITGQAIVDPGLFEKSYTPNDMFMWTQGRLVGADEPNRNGAYWTSGDLELGQATVKFGPLNWLHEGKHIIGTLAEAAFVKPGEKAADGQITQSHIAVVAPVWKWLYPEEADVIEMASDASKLWYSMECISKTVACLADDCGAEIGYMDYIHQADGTCDHMKARSAPRHLANPTFLGAAVIVPPVRPGWANADATVMQQAAQFAEQAFEDAGRPDVSASEWEQLMAQVVYATQ